MFGKKKAGKKFNKLIGKEQLLGNAKISRRDSPKSNEAKKTKQLNEQLYDIFETSPIGYFIYDKHFRIKKVNQKGTKIFKLNKEELTHKHLPHFIADDFQDIFKYHINKLLETKEIQHCEIKVIPPEEKPLHLFFHSNLIEDKKHTYIRSAFIDISDRVQMESSLRDSEEKYRLITENGDALIFELDQDNNIILSNDSFKQRFGLSEKMEDTSIISRIMHADDYMALKKVTRKLYQKYFLPENKTWKFKDKNGEWLTFKCSLSVNLDSYGNKSLLIIANDITEQLKAQENYKKTNELYRSLIDSIPNMNLYMFDKDLRIILADGDAIRQQRDSNTPILGKTLSDIYYKEKDRELKEYLNNLFQIAIEGETASAEYQHENNFYHVNILPISNNADYNGLAIIRNITEHKNITSQLEDAKNQAIKANEAKSKFLANVSHEIRTPMNAIIGFCEQLSKTALNKQQKNYNNYIYQSSNHLLSIINDMLIISKTESGKMVLENVDFNINDLFSEVYHILEEKADEKALSFNHFSDDQGIEWIRGDPARLKQILINLVNNAIKFTEKGSVNFSFKVLNDKQETVKLKILVEDTGIGIPNDKIREIFEEFKQLDSRRIRQYAGTGLGLSVVKKLVELLHGSISVESKINQGTTFKIIIPYEMGKPVTQVNSEDWQARQDLTGKKVLLVEDDEMNAILGQTILQDLNASVELAFNGDEAIEKSKHKKYDLILMDIHMPTISGNEAAREIRQMPDNPNRSAKIIALTANVVESELQKFLNDGMDDYFLKPFKEKDLYQKLREWLGVGDSKQETVGSKQKEEDSRQETGGSGQEEEVSGQGTGPLFDMADLKDTAKGNKDFIHKMLDLFISNTETNRQKLENALLENNYKKIGETAHKMIGSFRHMRVAFLNDLIALENKTLHQGDDSNVRELTQKILENTAQLIQEIKHEKYRLA